MNDFVKIMTKLNDVPFNPWIERDNGSKVYWEAHINYKGGGIVLNGGFMRVLLSMNMRLMFTLMTCLLICLMFTI